MIHDPENTKPYDKLWAVLSVDEKGNEGILAMLGPMGAMQCVTGSEVVLKMMVESVKADAGTTKKKIVVAEFSRSKTSAI